MEYLIPILVLSAVWGTAYLLSRLTHKSGKKKKVVNRYDKQA